MIEAGTWTSHFWSAPASSGGHHGMVAEWLACHPRERSARAAAATAQSVHSLRQYAFMCFWCAVLNHRDSVALADARLCPNAVWAHAQAPTLAGGFPGCHVFAARMLGYPSCSGMCEYSRNKQRQRPLHLSVQIIFAGSWLHVIGAPLDARLWILRQI